MIDTYTRCCSTFLIDKLSEYFINNKYIYVSTSLVNFFYRRINHLSGYQKEALFLYYLENN